MSSSSSLLDPLLDKNTNVNEEKDINRSDNDNSNNNSNDDDDIKISSFMSMKGFTAVPITTSETERTKDKLERIKKTEETNNNSSNTTIFLVVFLIIIVIIACIALGFYFSDVDAFLVPSSSMPFTTITSLFLRNTNNKFYSKDDCNILLNSRIFSIENQQEVEKYGSLLSSYLNQEQNELFLSSSLFIDNYYEKKQFLINVIIQSICNSNSKNSHDLQLNEQEETNMLLLHDNINELVLQNKIHRQHYDRADTISNNLIRRSHDSSNNENPENEDVMDSNNRNFMNEEDVIADYEKLHSVRIARYV